MTEDQKNDQLVSLDDLAKERLSQRLIESINRITEFFMEIRLDDEHFTVRANKHGVKVNSQFRYTGLGIILFAIIGGLWKMFM